MACLILLMMVASMAEQIIAAPPTGNDIRMEANKLKSQGNWKDAFELYKKVLTDPAFKTVTPAEDYRSAIQCLNQLGNQRDIDSITSQSLLSYPDDWQLLSAAADQFLSNPHYGSIVKDVFNRGHANEVTGTWTDVTDQDRTQALIWYEKALQILSKQKEPNSSQQLSDLALKFATAIVNQRYAKQAWLLQTKTDLTKPPNYKDSESEHSSYTFRNAPVDQLNKPILYPIVENWNDAKNDGERLRWLLQLSSKNRASDRIAEKDAPSPANRMRRVRPRPVVAIPSTNSAELFWANFVLSQFGPATLQEDIWFLQSQDELSNDTNDDAENGELDKDSAKQKEIDKPKLGAFALHTLEDDEVIAKLASGIQKFKLPDDYNPIRIFQKVIESEANEQAYFGLFNLHCDRRQYDKAVVIAKEAIEKIPTSTINFKEMLEQVVAPRGRFDETSVQTAGEAAKTSIIYRNANLAEFTAQKVEVEKLLVDTQLFYKKYLPGTDPTFNDKPHQFPPDLLAPNDLLMTLTASGKVDSKYVGPVTATWSTDLVKLDKHWEKRAEIATPLSQAGLYVVTAMLSDKGPGKDPSANKKYPVRTLVWIQDTAIVRKQLNGQWLHFIGDSRTGKPIANATVEFFGYSHQYTQQGKPKPPSITQFAKNTNEQGMVVLDDKTLPQNYTWFVTARTKEGRWASIHNEQFWPSQNGNETYSALKAFGVTDRPAYRPGDSIHAKFWVATAQYGTDQKADTLTGRTFEIKLVDPQNKTLWSDKRKGDSFGSFDLDVTIPKNASLGIYSFVIDEGRIATNARIRIEEYRKPEFEVFIDAPNEPIQLGEKFKAKVRAKYFFGSPVTDATATITVTRTAFVDRYFPVRPFDWCYGPGYWYLGYDYAWYPGWRNWSGCIRPFPWWMPFPQREQPEQVIEQEVALDEKGEATVEIDTALAKAFQGKMDHEYRISVDVRDASRRTISNSGKVIAARKAFKIYAWSNRGYYEKGDKVVASIQARTLAGKPVKSKGTLEILRVTYDDAKEPSESLVDTLDIETNDEGNLEQSIVAGRPGQYRLKIVLKDDSNHQIEGGLIIQVRGNDSNGSDFRYNDLEIVPDKSEYKVGETVRLRINANRDDATVLLFLNPQQSVYPKPELITLKAKSTVFEYKIPASLQPNFYVEAVTVYDGQYHQETREIIVPPEKRVLNVDVKPTKTEYLPGEDAEVEVSVTDIEGKPVPNASLALAVYDRSLDQIAPDTLPPDIREYFWKWRRHHYPQQQENLTRLSFPIYLQNVPNGAPLGIFGFSMADDVQSNLDSNRRGERGATALRSTSRMRGLGGGGFGGGGMMRGTDMAMPMAAAPMAAMADGAAAPMFKSMESSFSAADPEPGAAASEDNAPSIRKDFADSAYWVASVAIDKDGKGKALFKMPENLTSWKISAWSLSDGVRVGSGSTNALTRKNLLVRLQTPRFLVDRDQVILSGLINNDFDEAIEVKVRLEQEGNFVRLEEPENAEVTITVAAHGQKRVDWKCRAVKSGEATLRVAAISSRESDAMELKLPVVVNGILKTESFAGTVRPGKDKSEITFTVPKERLADQSKLVVRLSPSLALSMVDALPYLVNYPYGCTEQTLNRFVPTVVTHKFLNDLKIDLEKVKNHRVNLNAQEIGDANVRAAQRKIFDDNPVFDNQEVSRMVDEGLQRLMEMQREDGGWGWFSGIGERSGAHTTAVVVRGLLVAKAAGAPVIDSSIERGLSWLSNYQARELQQLKNAATKTKPYKETPDDIDAFVFHILVEANRFNDEMQKFLYEHRNVISVHSKCLLAIATHKVGSKEQTDMLRKNVEQFLVQDAENETAYIRNQASWWYWYGSEIETTANYLKLLNRVEPNSQTSTRLVKYLLNNRKFSTRWNSTRDTALVIESFAEFLQITGEGKGNTTASVFLDGEEVGKVQFKPEDLFTTNNSIELTADAIKDGTHKLEIRKESEGNLYWNVYQTNFTLEDEIAAAGLELKVERLYYKLNPVQKDVIAGGDRGQVGEQKRGAFERIPLKDLNGIKSGDMVEIELVIDSKNDYEYIMIEDPKAASLEPMDLQSGYLFQAGLMVYRELRDQKVTFFIKELPRGKHSILHRVRCEAPGVYTALPATTIGMYAPELVSNSTDFDIKVED